MTNCAMALNSLHELVVSHLEAYRGKVLHPIQATLSDIDAREMRGIFEAFRNHNELTELRRTGFHAVLHAEYIIWMDSLLHEKLAVDGPIDGIWPRPSYLSSWFPPPLSSTRDTLLRYASLYVEHFAAPALAALELWSRHPFNIAGPSIDHVASPDVLAGFLQGRRDNCNDVEAFFAAR